MRTPYLPWGLLTLLIVALASPSPVFAQKKMLMQATLNPTQNDLGVAVAITGRVFDTANFSVPNAVISIQVNNPQGTSLHIAIAYTNPIGSFQDMFLIASNSPGGNYTAFVAANKPGYDAARVTLIFAYSSPDFSIQTSTPALSLGQGETGNVIVTVLSLRGFHDPVSLTALELPAGISLRFNPVSIVPSGSVIVDVSVSSFAAVGNHTITLLGLSGSITHKVSVQVDVFRGIVQVAYLLIVVITIVAALFIFRYRGKRKRKEAAVEALIRQVSADKGYIAAARAITRLEELRAMNRVDETTYQRLRKEYEKRLEKSK